MAKALQRENRMFVQRSAHTQKDQPAHLLSLNGNPPTDIALPTFQELKMDQVLVLVRALDPAA